MQRDKIRDQAFACASLRAMRFTRPILVAALVLSACGSSQTSTNDASSIGAGVDIETKSPQEAAKVLEEFRIKYGLERTPADSPPITSMAQVLEIIRHDQLRDFDAAREFAIGKQGPEALTIRAWLELSLAGAMLTAAAILEGERQQDVTELRQLQQPRSFGEPGEDQTAKIAKLKTRSSDLRKVVRALRVLSEEPLTSGEQLAEDAIHQDPKLQLGYLAQANYYRLRGNWLEFDRMMKYADDSAADPPVRSFLRGMEALERYVNAEKCRMLLAEALQKRPDFVRAQANLVLAERDINAKHAELQKLRAMSPNNLVVALAGNMIDEEYQTSVELRGVLTEQ